MSNPTRIYSAVYAWAVLSLLLVAMGAMVLYEFAPFDLAAMAASGAALFVLSSAYIFHRLADDLVSQCEEQEYRFGTVVDHASDGIMEIDRHGMIISMNPAAERLFGYRAKELLKGPLTAIAATPEFEDPADFLKDLICRAEQSPEHRCEIDGLRKEGGAFAMEVSVSESFEDEETPIYTVIARDVSARRSAEDALARRREELEHHVRERTRELKATNDLLESEIVRRNIVEIDRQKVLSELQEALTQIRTLTGFIPICASCKKVRDDSGFWNQIEEYVEKHSHAEFSHGVCPDCVKQLYPEFSDREENRVMPLD
jgi:PAS domain S-box-containing protein